MSSGFLLSGLGFAFVRMGGADYDPYDSDDSSVESKGLKPIVNAGGIKVKRLYRSAWRLGFEWAKRYLPIFFNADAMRTAFLKPWSETVDADGNPLPIPKIPPTNSKHITSLYKLRDWNVLRLRAPGEHFFVLGSYFEVPKKDGFERTIVDLRPLNALSNTPPRVCLAEIQQLLRDILRLGADGKGLWLSTGDFLNYYHQLPIPKRCHNMFAVKCRKIIFFMKTCPMGASWMCFMAQLATWTIILMSAPTDNADLGIDGKSFGLDIPPGIIYLRRDQGLLNCQYDNVLVCTKTRFLADKWVSRIKGNAAHVNAHWGADDVLCTPKRTAFHLGVDLDTTNVPRWRHIPTKVSKWNQWFERPRICTPRYVAKIVGISVWDASIRLLPLFMIDHVIDAIRFVHAKYNIRRKKDWYQPIELTPRLAAILRGHMLQILKNEWHDEPIAEISSDTWIAASDASEFGTGYVILQGQRGQYAHDIDRNDNLPGSSLPHSLIGVHIYILELYGAFRTVEAVSERLNGRRIKLILIMDNTAAKAAIGKWYSANKHALEIIKRIHALAQRSNIDLQIIWMASEDNPADAPSRRSLCHADPSWVRKCDRALEFVTGKWSYEYVGGARHEKLHDVTSEYSDATSSSDDEDELHDHDVQEDVWASDDDDSNFQSENNDVEDQLLNELNACFPDGAEPASMQEGLSQLLRILDGEHYSHE